MKIIIADLVLLLILSSSIEGKERGIGSRTQGIAIVTSVYTDKDNLVHLRYSNGKDVTPPREKGQVACSSPAVAEDKKTVGWLVAEEYCCTSYPIPLRLVIYRSGRIIRRLRADRIITRWRFLARGREVTFETDYLHGPSYRQYKRFDVWTGKMLDKWDGPCDEESPEWVYELVK